MKQFFRLLLVLMAGAASLHADDGYRLWLRYEPLATQAQRDYLREQIACIVAPGSSPTVEKAVAELQRGLGGLSGQPVDLRAAVPELGSFLLLATADDEALDDLELADDLDELGPEGYRIQSVERDGQTGIVIAANRDIGLLYGSFALLREVQTAHSLSHLDLASKPHIQRRLLNHWDNLTRTVERGTAGQSLWEWFQLPDYRTPRYEDYARACASVGINGVSLTNVNADALVLTPQYLEKVAALADVFRPYGIRVYLTARFSAPMELAGLDTADPLDDDVRDWWQDKVSEIYARIPDFGGFLVKANSEGQPGPQDYGRNHAEGANMLADALAPHDGIVIWRAFVYAAEEQEDRVKQAYNEFQPLDGQFRDNVAIQIKNGPLDFMPREPVHPLFGAMPETNLALELQLTQEYLGTSVQLAYLAPLYEEVLDTDTFAEGPGSTVAKVIDGSLTDRKLSVISGVANIGTDRNWTGHPLAQSNWYAYGRLAWNPELSSDQIAQEWTRMSFDRNPAVEDTLVPMLMASRETVVDYSMPLGLHHIMAWDHHYGPGPWVDQGRPDWTATYYHRADREGLGFDRTSQGSNALEQYAPELRQRWERIETTPLNLLLWFHHVPWDYRLRTGNILWDELAYRYQRGVDAVREWEQAWADLQGQIDAQRYAHVAALLKRQEKDAVQWRDAVLLYFQQFSQRPLPAGVEAPAHDLEYYQNLQEHYVPGTPSHQ
ncbi:MAG: alpha-glucuronidase [Puniceicoccaceae bacterium 5H]|nr:MAG: alpha-glucuronidase [Puniceicoccaceae bacterium 5H]